MIGDSEMKNQEKKSISITARILAGALAILMLAGTVFGVIVYII